MALTWDLTNIKAPEGFKIWIDNPDPKRTDKELYVLNGLTEIIIFATMFVGISNITNKNAKEFYNRIRQFGVATATEGLLHNPETKQTRMPTLEEIEWHTGLKTNATSMTKRQWSSNIARMVADTVKEQDSKALREEKQKEDDSTKQ